MSGPGERCPQVLGDVTWGGRRQGSSFSLEPRTGRTLANHLGVSAVRPVLASWPPRTIPGLFWAAELVVIGYSCCRN